MAMPVAAKTTRLAALFSLLMLVIIMLSSSFKLVVDNSTLCPQLSVLTRKHDNSTNYRRFLRLEGHLTVIDRKHKFSFVLQSAAYPATHPSQPYYVMTDEAGEHLQTIEDGHPDYPLSRLADFREPRDAQREAVFFFVVPKSSGGIVKAIVSKCYNLRRTEKREDPESMTFIDGVLNIDTQTLKGLTIARAEQVIDSGLVDVFATSYFLEGMLLFRTNRRGRAFTILQHPVLRAESLFYSRHATLELLGLTEFMDSVHYIDNWLVRSLTNFKRGEITEDHFTVAKGILARKFLVGVDEYLEETIKRLEIYYGWGEENGDRGCVNKYLEISLQQRADTHHTIERGDEYWNLIAAKDKFDLMLYYYALELFVKQGTTMFSRPYVDKKGEHVNFTELKKKRLKEELMALRGLPPT